VLLSLLAVLESIPPPASLPGDGEGDVDGGLGAVMVGAVVAVVLGGGMVPESTPPVVVLHLPAVHDSEQQSVATPQFITLLLSGFSGLALLLACLGIYGVISYIAVQRTHEIGIRMALGAEKGDVLKMIIGEGIRPTLAGVAIGIFGALRLTRLLSSILYGVKPTDPFTFAAVSFILIGVALLACYIPARRAAKADPMLALRYE